MGAALAAALCAGLTVWVLFRRKGSAASGTGTDNQRAYRDDFRRFRLDMMQKGSGGQKLRALLELLGSFSDFGAAGRELRRDYAAAGWPGDLSDNQLIGLPVLVALPVAAGAFVPFLLLAPPLALAAPVFGFAAGYLAVKWWIGQKQQARRSAISKSMPFVMDLIGMSMNAGASLLNVLEMIRVYYGAHPVGEEFALVGDKIQRGVPLVEAMQSFKDRLQLVPIACSFADDVIQAARYGRPLAQTLEDSSRRFKAMRIQIAREQAGKGKVKILVPGILVLFGGLLILFGPFIVKFVNEQSSLGAGFLQ